MSEYISNATALQLTVVVPTYNESKNIGELIRRLGKVLFDISWEVVVIDDDSPDKTYEVVKAMASKDARVRCIRRVGRRGLSGACIEGILSSASPYVLVMDADLQHDENVIPEMLRQMDLGADLVVGSRYVEGGASGEGFSAFRQWGSDLATKLARSFLKVSLQDPMSGFFMMRRNRFDGLVSRLSKDGFKLLLDILASSKQRLSVVEVPFKFRERLAGESKLDTLVTVDYLGLLLSKMTGGFLPVRFFMFMAVGASGVLVHLASLKIIISQFSLQFAAAQLSATMVAMTWNYFLNNRLTFRDRRLKGFSFFVGLLTFYFACSIGTVANVGAASWFYGIDHNQMLSGLAGALLGAVFNYVATSVFTWKK